MNYLALGLILIILMILYYVYSYFTNNSLTSGLQELKKPITITYDKLKSPNIYTYSFQGWFYLSNPTDKYTPIFDRKDSDANNKPVFEVGLTGQELVLKAGKGDAEPTKIMTITPDFPMQKWTYLVINVFNLQTFEAYINGKLAKTVNYANGKALIPTSHTNDLHIGNSKLDGYVTKLARNTNVVDAKTVWNDYLNGNGISSLFKSLMPYGLDMTISKGEDLQRVVNLF